MHKHIFPLIAGVLLFISNVCLAQNLIHADPSTGAAGINIPIYVVRSGGVAVPVSISYQAGVKPKDVEGTAGMGWQLNAGGQVSRVVRGLPDDITKDNAGSQRLGWMSSLDTAATKISAFTIANNGSNCSYETTDLSYISTNFPYRNDTEPDMFYVSAPGLSCQLVYSRDSSKFKPVGYQDLVITYTTIGGTGNNASEIASFTITNDKGVKYVFSQGEQITQQSKAPTGGVGSYYTQKYEQYISGITYFDSWVLTSVTDANANGISISYGTHPATLGADSVALYIGGSNAYRLQYRTLNTILTPEMFSISTFNTNGGQTALNFQWQTFNNTGETGQSVVDSISGSGRLFLFNYTQSDFTTKTGSTYIRNFLRNFYEPGASSPLTFQFLYYGETLIGTPPPSGSYLDNARTYVFNTTLPDSSSTQRDYWGYYSTYAPNNSLEPKAWIIGTDPSGSYPRYAIYESNTGSDIYGFYTTNGNIRTADSLNVMAGSLTKLSYPNGGSENIVYESNDYVDGPSGNVVKGSGVRVKTLIDSTGNAANTIVRNYSYTNSSTGISSGTPVTLPQFSFTIPYSGTATGNALWNDCTAMSAYDLSTEDHTIIYQYSKVSQTGAGSTRYQFTIPATNQVNSAAPSCSGCTTNEWFSSVEYMGRGNCLASYGPLGNLAWSFPFTPNPNYDFERGLPVNITSYNDAGYEVSESDYTYKRYNATAPSAITAFKWDNDASGTLTLVSYGKYTVFYNVAELTATVISKTYGTGNSTAFRADTVNYTYGSSYHKLLTKTQTNNSDGSTLTNNITYIKDYPAASAGSNANANAVHYLRSLNMDLPVESYQQLTRSGATQTTSAGLNLYAGFTEGGSILYLPSQQRKLLAPDGITNFTPLTISGQSLAADSRYYPVMNFDTYDINGFPLTVDDTYKNIKTTLINHFANQPIAQFSNAYYNQVAYSDFDGDYYDASPPYAFTISGSGSYSPVGSHAGNAAGLAASTQTVTSPTLSKNSTAVNYIFSIWINPSAAGSLSLTLSGMTTHPTLSFNSAGAWKYYEIKIPAAAISSSFTLSFTTSQNISIDDILVYPDVAEVNTATYDPVTHYKLDQTNTNGVSSYFTTDQWGRVTYAYDRDKNIVQKNSYVTTSEIYDFNNMNITYLSELPGDSIHENAPVTFTLNGLDITPGAKVTWNFGDGSLPVVVSATTTPSHSYSQYGPYIVTATVNSPLFGIKTVTENISVNPGNITLHYTNNLPVGTGGLQSVQFQQGGVTKYTFYNYQISGAVILQGNYTIVLNSTNPNGHTNYCTICAADCWWGCATYTSGTTLTQTLTANLSTCTTLSIYADPNVCPTPP